MEATQHFYDIFQNSEDKYLNSTEYHKNVNIKAVEVKTADVKKAA